MFIDYFMTPEFIWKFSGFKFKILLILSHFIEIGFKKNNQVLKIVYIDDILVLFVEVSFLRLMSLDYYRQ